MKKILLLAATAMLSSLVSFADGWIKPSLPTPKTSALETTTEESAADASAYYLYNVDGGAFYGCGNEWCTRATLVESPISYHCNETNNTRTAEPLKIKLVKFADTDNYGIMWVKNDGKTDYTSPDGPEGIWIDGKRLNYNEFTITPTTGDNFTIGCDMVLADGLLGVLSTEESATPRINLYVPTELPEGATLFCNWALVSEEDYLAVRGDSATLADYNLAVQTYNTAVALKAAIDNAQEEYPTCDFSEPLAVYNNTASTLEQLNEANRKITIIINDYNASQASFTNPADLTSQIGNGSDVAPWIREFTGEGQVGTWHTNTWSTEANNGADGTNMTTPFCEDWVASGNLLSDQKIYQVVKDCAPGLYVFKANVRLYNEQGNQDNLTGCTMYFGDDHVTLDEQVKMFKSGNKCVLWKDGGFQLITVLEETGDIEVGFEIKNATFNWVAFKETSLTYYGNDNAAEHALELFKEGYEFEAYDEEYMALSSLVAEYNEAFEAYNNATTIADVRTAADKMSALRVNINSSNAAYEALSKKVEEWQNSADTENHLGSTWENFVSFVGGDAVEGYPTPSLSEIFDEKQYTLTNEEITSYINKVDSLWAAAVASSLTEGDDCSSMLVNPNFADKDGKGWTWLKNDGETALNKRGGNEEFYCAEAYGGWAANQGFLFDVYQDVTGVPDGVYQISANCFYRWADNGQFDGTENVPAVIYMNEYQSPVQHIASDAMPEDQIMTEGEDGKLVLQEGWYGSWVNTDGIGYVPNSMDAASCAFKKDMYKQTVYGLVEGGKMRIGIKKETKTAENRHWCLWTNFKLIYEGESLEAFQKMLKPFIADAENMLEMQQEKMTKPAIEELEDAIALAEKASSAEAAKEALKVLNDAMAAGRANIAAAAQVENALNNLQTVEDEVNEMEDEELLAEYEELYNYFDEELYYENGTEEINAKIEAVDAFVTKVKDAHIVWAAEAKYAALAEIVANATDDEPAVIEQDDDLGDLAIVNGDLTTGNANGWTLDIIEATNKGYQANASYTGDTIMVAGEEYIATCNQFIEVWRSGNAPILGDIYQKVLLPAGTYKLSADIIASYQADGNAQVVGCYLYAGESHMEVSTGNGKPKHFELIFKVEEDRTLVQIGINCSATTNANWLAADNFVLTAYGKNSKIEENGEENAISSATAESLKAIFDLTGRKVEKAQKGLYIINGKKVVVK